MANRPVEYLVFDVESVADPELVARLRYPAKGSGRPRRFGGTGPS